MDYPNLFHSIPWEPVGISVLQTVTVYVLVLVGLKLVGRRVFGERSPQDLITLLLIAESCDMGLADQTAGYWGSIFSVITILLLGYLSDRIKWIDDLLNPDPIVLCREGRINQKAMDKNMVEERDLEEIAREYGVSSYHDFSVIMLEGGGHLTGVLRSATSRGKNQKPKKVT